MLHLNLIALLLTIGGRIIHHLHLCLLDGLNQCLVSEKRLEHFHF